MEDKKPKKTIRKFETNHKKGFLFEAICLAIAQENWKGALVLCQFYNSKKKTGRVLELEKKLLGLVRY